MTSTDNPDKAKPNAAPDPAAPTRPTPAPGGTHPVDEAAQEEGAEDREEGGYN